MRWLSPLEFFEQAEELPGLAYSSPGVGVAQWQLLLGLCYATGIHPRNPAQWEQWVRDGHDLSEVARRLREAPFDDGRFRLFDPNRPFGQNAQLGRHMREHGYGTAQLVMERAADRAQLVDHVHLHDPEPLPLGVAVQAMLTQLHYGLGGRVRAKTDWMGKPFTYGAVGRLTSRVHTLALGRNCADTLRLNLQPTARPGTFNYSWTDGKTRRTFDGKASDKAGRGVDGPADLCSVLGRSILLQPDVTDQGDIVVTKVLMGAGELLRPLGQKHLQDVPLDGDRPLAPSTDRAMWRQSHALYAAALPNTKDSDLFSRLLRLKIPVQLWTVGLVAKQRSPLDWVSDTFPFHGAHHMPLLRAATDGVAWANAVDKAMQRASATARDLVYPNSRPEDRARLLRRFYPSGELWAQFEEPFHALLAAVADGALPEPEARAAFAARLVAVARSALTGRLRTLPRSPVARQARVLSAARLERELTARTAPPELKEAAMATSLYPAGSAALTVSAASAGAADAPASRAGGHQMFAHWLAGLVRVQDQAMLGQLCHRVQDQQARMLAAEFAPNREARPAYVLTAHLFARYHQGLPWREPVRLYGSGDVGKALRGLGSPAGRGPKDPGIKRLFDRVCGARDLPATGLQTVIDRLRTEGRFPPSWSQLAQELSAWDSREETTQDAWAESFYTPNSRARQGATS
ncbi:type I-E CRISPR-associated protein Cse1/CasA [Streptomyces xanthochromogenes]|uniref:type I-E CRISPR-associated protein Cse1/CasA n=1 Tax=Streptomyces xanthochromogenes TaxID=67384 RepID=UPI00342D2F7C